MYYAKVAGSSPVNVFSSDRKRKKWMGSHHVETTALSAKEAKRQAERDRWIRCHFPAKPPRNWDGCNYVWYRTLERTDGRVGEYVRDEAIEWHRYEL